eukprot:TRINITY_DN347_c0_g1_i8.p1 TRINITY_DN347_c0_g1~~TRINITY_DN347_c0_g1_i8.p1  ORF type:complete len:242 (+),score=87.58 TRINITY_DN347_c0_g1_i8:67-726(+)
MAPKVALTYFNIQGAAEKVRLALVLNGVEFEDIRVEMEKWPEMKPKTKYGQLPIMTIDGKEISQSGAMLRWAGRLGDGKLYPADPEEQLRVEEVVGMAEDLIRAWMPCLLAGFRPEVLGHEVEGDAKAALVKRMREKFVAEAMPQHFNFLVGKLQESKGGFFCGDHPTIADCMIAPLIASFQSGVIDHVPTDCVAKYPALAEWHARFMAIPAVKAWYSK